MSKIKAGIVLVNKYCSAEDSRFRGYIDYIDRDEAVRNEHMDQFNLYQDYMDDPDKTTGLFTGTKSYLTRTEKKELKEIFKTAQENGSLMWQPIISFDNRWLAENGLWDSKRKILDEVKMKEFTQKSVNKMLKNEGLENAVWSASFHYNTDNIHIHIAVVEPNPMREKKLYKVYDYIPDPEGDYIYSKYNTYLKATKKNMFYYSQNGKRYRREERIDANGKNVFSEEYKGKFQQKSLEFCKSTFVNEILRDKDYGIKINALIRDSIVKRKADINLHADPDLKRFFLDLHASMPRKGNRGLWNYNNNIMKPLQPKIDKISDLYLEKYHPKEMQELKELLQIRSEQYERAYGESQREYAENKLQELHTRLGNAILKEMRKYDQLLADTNLNFFESHEELENKEDAIYKLSKIFIEEKDVKNYPRVIKMLTNLSEKGDNEKAQYALGKFYLNEETEYHSLELGEKYLKMSAEKGNAYAQYALGKFYLDKEEKHYRPKLAEKYLLSALEKENQPAKYLLGKTYLDSESELYNPQRGLRHMFELSENDNQYAQIKLGLEYIKGVHIPRDVSAGCELLTKAKEQGNPIAECILNNIHRNEMFFRGKQAAKTLIKDMKRMNTYMSYKINQALRILKNSMDQEHEKARRQNQYEYDQLMNFE